MGRRDWQGCIRCIAKGRESNSSLPEWSVHDYLPLIYRVCGCGPLCLVYYSNYIQYANVTN